MVQLIWIYGNNCDGTLVIIRDTVNCKSVSLKKVRSIKKKVPLSCGHFWLTQTSTC